MPKKEKDLLAEMTADLQRVQADFVNFRRRVEDDRRELMSLAKSEVVTELLPLIDNLDRALNHRPKELEGNAWAEGVGAVAKQAEEQLRKLGVEKIESLGQPFDPMLHEAVAGEGEIITEELQPGYRMGERILRPAMVKVGKEK